jgi:hypothetical protein
MRNLVLILLLFSLNSYSQIIGRTMLYDEGCWTMISINNEVPFKTTDGEGNFELKLPKPKNDVFIQSSWVSIEIKNVPNSKKINIGEINLPMRKSLSGEEYENLSSKEKERCNTIMCWAQLVGYEYKDQLSQTCITIKCGEMKYEICDFKFDVENQKVVIEWEKIKACEK